MATATLITEISRRTMLAGTMVVPAIALPAVAALPAMPAGAGPDAALLRWTAAAERIRAAFVRADAHCLRLHDALRLHPDYPDAMPGARGARWDALYERMGLPEAEARCDRLYDLYNAATRAAFDLPAHALPGAHAKIRLAVGSVKQFHCGGWDGIDCEYLDLALADLNRLSP